MCFPFQLFVLINLNSPDSAGLAQLSLRRHPGFFSHTPPSHPPPPPPPPPPPHPPQPSVSMSDHDHSQNCCPSVVTLVSAASTSVQNTASAVESQDSLVSSASPTSHADSQNSISCTSTQTLTPIEDSLCATGDGAQTPNACSENCVPGSQNPTPYVTAQGHDEGNVQNPLPGTSDPPGVSAYQGAGTFSEEKIHTGSRVSCTSAPSRGFLDPDSPEITPSANVRKINDSHSRASKRSVRTDANLIDHRRVGRLPGLLFSKSKKLFWGTFFFSVRTHCFLISVSKPAQVAFRALERLYTQKHPKTCFIGVEVHSVLNCHLWMLSSTGSFAIHS